ncbi:VanZ family protein [Neobacillus sp. PS3-40]|uniref:VanZ family protein n=1 Tax=Neobacillus sp. PS3-40 TaxID=3070679 RepID=UPI0027E191C9|nr:VanZ family protein [Neobacillus sp. PS3-40]WML46177.1 VanZ family protein [Neobacillus sp. PS3-40]
MGKKKWIITLILWLAMIFICTQLPYFKGENTEAAIHKTISTSHVDLKLLNLIVRKATHLTVFGILAVLFFKSLGKFRFAYILSWFLTVVYAITDEYHQSFMPGRESSYKDVMLDSIGAILALLIVYFMKKRRSTAK